MRGIVLIVDDHGPPRRVLARELEDADFAVVEAADGEEGWECFLRHAPDVVITDLMMPRANGQDLLERIRLRSDVPVILFSAYGSVETAVAALKAGADDFVSSDGIDIDGLVERVKRAVEERRHPTVPAAIEERLVGRSPAMTRIRERVASLAPLSNPVLIAGEPGTGRDSVARALHDFGSSAGGEMLRIDCASFSPESPDREYTAVYLDGVETLSPKAQVHWMQRLQATQGGRSRGGSRLLASTADPQLSGGAVDFHPVLREQLLRFAIELPALREHREDIPDLADALVEALGTTVGRSVQLSPSAREFLAARSWPGNTRQLEQLLERAIAFTRGPFIRRELLEQVCSEAEQSLARVRKHRGWREREDLLDAIEQTGGNVSRTAEILGKSRSSVYRLLEKHGISLS